MGRLYESGGLVLARKVNERIFIGPDIEITVAEISHAAGQAPKVRLHIVAPKHLRIDREEIAEARKADADA